MNSKSNTQAMETEKVPRLLAQLAIPAVVAQVINLMLINAFAMLAGSGGAPRAAIFMGKKDNKTAEKILGNCFALLIVMAVALTAIFFIFAPQLLTLFGASDKTLPYGVAYARIYILGSIFVLIVMGMNPFITTQGFAKISMMTTVIGAERHYLTLSCTWYFYLCHVIYRKYPVCQLHVQPFKVWRGSCCWSHDNYYKCQPACHITITGNLSGWTADYEL